MFPFTKTEVWQAAKLLQETRLEENQHAILKVRESGNNESKSSMGDKYETGKAMSQNELFMLSQQQENLQQEFRKLLRLDPGKVNTKGEIGALVQTETAYCYIGAAIGTFYIGSYKVSVISEVSPLAKSLNGKEAGSSINPAGKSIQILAIC